MSIDVYAVIRNTIKKEHLFDNCTGLIIAVSGGSDSMTLLDFFGSNRKDFPFDMAVCHINHGLRPEADDEQAFVCEQSKKYDIPFYALKADILGDLPKGKSVEEYARDVRYAFFTKIKNELGYSHIATAHNADDNIETLFINLLRGSGAAGCGIAVKRNDNAVRPLLNVSKSDIYENCKSRHIPFVTDKTNFESICRRNVIRNELMPFIRKIEPSADKALTRFIMLQRDDNAFLEKTASTHMKHFENGIDIAYAKALDRPILSRCIRNAFESVSCGLTLDCDMTDRVIGLLDGSTSDRQTLFNGYYAVVSYGMIFFKKETEPQSIPRQKLHLGENRIDGLGTVIVSDGGDIDRSFAEMMFIRSRLPGDTIRLNGHTKKLKELFIDKKIPSEYRPLVFVIEADGNVIHIRDVGTADDAKNKDGLCVTVKI